MVDSTHECRHAPDRCDNAAAIALIREIVEAMPRCVWWIGKGKKARQCGIPATHREGTADVPGDPAWPLCDEHAAGVAERCVEVDGAPSLRRAIAFLAKKDRK